MSSGPVLPQGIRDQIEHAVQDGFERGLRIGDVLPVTSPGQRALLDFRITAEIGRRELRRIQGGSSIPDPAQYRQLGRQVGQEVLGYILWGVHRNGEETGLLTHDEIPTFEPDDPVDWEDPRELTTALTRAILRLPNYGLGTPILLSQSSSSLREWIPDRGTTPLQDLQGQHPNLRQHTVSEIPAGEMFLIRTHRSTFRVQSDRALDELEGGTPYSEAGSIKIPFHLGIRLQIGNPSGVLRIEMR